MNEGKYQTTADDSFWSSNPQPGEITPVPSTEFELGFWDAIGKVLTLIDASHARKLNRLDLYRAIQKIRPVS